MKVLMTVEEAREVCQDRSINMAGCCLCLPRIGKRPAGAMRFKTAVLVLYLLISLSKNVRSNVIDMVVSFALMDERPTSLLVPDSCWSTHKLKQLARSLNNVGMSIATSLQYNRTEIDLQYILILADLSCPGSKRHLLRASEDGYFKSPYRWIIISAGEDLSVMENLDILVDSDVVIAQKISAQQYTFTEVYKISENSEVIYATRAAWWSAPQFSTSVSTANIQAGSSTRVSKYGRTEDYRTTKVITFRRRNLRKHTLTMINVLPDTNDSIKHLDDRLFLNQDSISKVSYAIVTICFDMLNSTQRHLFTNTWGYKDKSGGWDGLLKHLMKKEADIGTLSMLTLERSMLVDYIAKVGTTAVRFLFRDPPLPVVSNIFVLPFSRAVWLAVLVCILACALLMYIASKWEARAGIGSTQLNGSWTDVLILIVGAVSQQGCTLEPRLASGRCITLIIFMSLTILYAAYSANIVVLLRTPSSSVRTLPDLLNSPFKVGADDYDYNRYFFKKLNEPVRKAIYDQKIAPKGQKPNFYSTKDGLEKVRKGLFAFHVELNMGYRVIQETYQEHEKCDLVEIDYINEVGPWVPVTKRSPFKDMFKVSLIRIRETGVQANSNNRLVVGRPRCSGDVSAFSSVGIMDMYPALIMTIYGMLLAPAILLMEIMFKRLTRIKAQKKLLMEQDRLSFH